MNIKDVDNKVAAVVLRRSQEISQEHSSRILVETLRSQDIPEPLIQRTVKACSELQVKHNPRLNSIMAELESGAVNFDDTVISLMKFSIEIGGSTHQVIQDIMEQSIASGELDKFMDEAKEASVEVK